MTPQDIIRAVSEASGVPEHLMYTKGRDRNKVEARQMAMMIMRDYAGMKQIDIAHYFGMNHTTIAHGIEQINNLINADTRLRTISINALKSIGIESQDTFIVHGPYDTVVTNGPEVVLNQDGSIICLTKENIRTIYLSTVA